MLMYYSHYRYIGLISGCYRLQDFIWWRLSCCCRRHPMNLYTDYSFFIREFKKWLLLIKNLIIAYRFLSQINLIFCFHGWFYEIASCLKAIISFICLHNDSHMFLWLRSRNYLTNLPLEHLSYFLIHFSKIIKGKNRKIPELTTILICGGVKSVNRILGNIQAGK